MLPSTASRVLLLLTGRESGHALAAWSSSGSNCSAAADRMANPVPHGILVLLRETNTFQPWAAWDLRWPRVVDGEPGTLAENTLDSVKETLGNGNGVRAMRCSRPA